MYDTAWAFCKVDRPCRCKLSMDLARIAYRPSANGKYVLVYSTPPTCFPIKDSLLALTVCLIARRQ